MKRRTILIASSTSAAVAAVAGVVAVRSEPGPPELDGLDRDERAHGAELLDKLDGLIVPPLVVRAYLDDRVRHKLKTPRRVRSKHLKAFLFSTDFFPDADESRPLSYRALYDPYVTPCSLPIPRNV